MQNNNQLKAFDGVFLLTVLFISGFVLMGFEMLGSRYLNPYFGGGITTWACLISTVLFAMMLGYLFGGQLADKLFSVIPLSLAFAGSAIYIFLVAYLADDVLLFIIDNIGDGFVGVLLGSIFLVFVPVFLLSACSPYVVRLLLHSASYGGRVTGKVYAISTGGNILGTLITTFWFIPSIGSRSITKIFSLILVLLAVVVFVKYRKTKLESPISNLIIFAAIGLFAFVGASTQVIARPILIPASYPEGPVMEDDRLLYGEMGTDRVSMITPGKHSAFFTQKGCGPTSISKVDETKYAVNCHLGAKVLFLDRDGKLLKEITASSDAGNFTNPNDITADGEGGVIFSDPGPFAEGSNHKGRIFRIDKDYNTKMLDEGMKYPNGVTFEKASRTLWVSEHLGRSIWKLSFDKDWKLLTKEKYLEGNALLKIANNGCTNNQLSFERFSGPDGIRIDEDGNKFIALYGLSGLVVITSSGQAYCRPVPFKFPTSMAFHKGRMVVTGTNDILANPKTGFVLITNKSEFVQSK